MSDSKKILVFYWSEDTYSKKLEKFMKYSFKHLGYEVVECRNLAGDGPTWHGKPMVNNFKHKKLSKGFRGQQDPVQRVFGRLFLDLESEKAWNYKNIDMHLFVIHVDGEMFKNNVAGCEKKIIDKTKFVLCGHDMKHIYSAISTSKLPIKMMACIPVKEFENWLVQTARESSGDTRPLPNSVDEAEDAKEEVHRCLTGAPKKREDTKLDSMKADLVNILNFNSLAHRSSSYRHMEKTVADTVACKKGLLLPFRNSRPSEKT